MKKLFTLLSFVLAFGLQATHNRAGEITYRWQGGLTYEVQITTYTRSCNFCADRCELTINWGEPGQTSILQRVNGPSNTCNNGARDGVIIDAANEIKENIYIGQHTYSSPGQYTLSVEDQNRNAGIANIINSDQVPFYIESSLFVGGSLGPNSSPILTNPPIERGCLRKRFEHNAGAYDPDKTDSLSYRLVPSRTTGGAPLTTIYDPQFVQDSVRMEPDGTLVWDAPQSPGQYNFAFEIIEWRKNRNGRYTRIGMVTRDMQVDIEDCGNNPPVIQPVGPFCVEAGQTLRFSVTATDPDGDDLELSAFGAPFEIAPVANPFSRTGAEPLSHTFTWNTACSHVKRLPHAITFKAQDIPADRSETPLADLFTTDITVIAPAPKNPTVEPNGDGLALNWNKSFCADAQGYLIYRRESAFGFVPSECETGVPDYTGYTFLDSNRAGLLDTSYVDNDSLEIGVQYCYMVVAYFNDEAQSYASEEFCASLPLSLPLITKADVESTSTTNGSIRVEWIAPPELDTTLFPAPYQYRLLFADSINGTSFTELTRIDVNALVDTAFQHQSLNTQDLGYRYRVDFYAGPNLNLVGSSTAASSIFLEPQGVDESVRLNMTHQTPWLNERYTIFRENPTGSGIFDSIGQSFTPTYLDTGLINGQEYCYRVTGYGRYTASDSLPDIENRSQIACAVARDTIAPCAPELIVRTICPDTIVISWQIPKNQGCPTDIKQINIYFRTPNESFGSVPAFTFNTGNDSTITFVNDGELFGCFAVTAVDDASGDAGGQANESAFSKEVCLESCFELQFPNVFSPNGDGQNDFFRALNINQLQSLKVDIYNRWGGIIYRAATLEEFVANGWDGTVQATGQPAADGVYYYVARFTPKSLGPVREQVTAGFVHLFR
jgi:gliding motility-associated-like protein